MTTATMTHMTENTSVLQNLTDHAIAMKKQALCMYSNFQVGAALLSTNGNITGGFNIESASYGLTMCAERVALFSALAQNQKHFTHMALVTDPGAFPCGACRQLIYEFCPNITIIIATPTKIIMTLQAKDLLPYGFCNNALENSKKGS